MNTHEVEGSLVVARRGLFDHYKNRINRMVGSFLGFVGASVVLCFPAIAQSGSSSQTAPASTSPSDTTNSSSSVSAFDRTFMTKAAQSDMTEIQTSQLALQKSQNPEIRDYAERMIQEHTNSSKQLMQIAKSKNVSLPKDIGAQNKVLLAQLKELEGKKFDRAYMEGQVQAHSKTQAEYQKYLKKGENPALRAFANKIAPIVAEHLEMAQSMVASR